MELERRNEEDEGRILGTQTLEEYLDDFFAGANPTQSQWLTLPPLPAVSSVPTTPAASTAPLISGAPPSSLSLPQSAPPQRQISLPPIAVPLTLPPSRAPAPPETPPLRRRRLQASPITPALGVNNESSTRSHSAPCTPANSTMLSPVTPSSNSLLGGLVGEEPYAPSAELARFVCSRIAGTDSTPQYEALLKEVSKFVEKSKCNMREKLREQFEREKGVLTPKERTRFRSRRGAAVSRFKVVHTKQTLEEAALWCVAHLACPVNTTTSSQSSEVNTSFGAPTSNSMQSPSSPPHTTLLSPPSSSLGSMATISVTQAVSPRTELANTLTSLSLRTPSNIVSTHSPYTPPAMSLPPAKSMLSPEGTADDALLSTVTKVPINTEVVGGTEFRLSAELQTALLSRHCVTQVEGLMERVRAEVKQFVDEKKGLVREEYKTRLNEMKEKLTAKSRMRGRSRRGAAVTRFKNSATIGAWEDSLRWFIDNIHAPETT